MKAQFGHFNASGNSQEPGVASELIRLIRKLRWIGLDEEADLIKVKLASHRPSHADSVLAAPLDTD